MPCKQDLGTCDTCLFRVARQSPLRNGKHACRKCTENGHGCQHGVHLNSPYQSVIPNLVHGQKGMNHTVVFEFVKHAVHRGLVDLIVQDVKQHACRKCLARLAKHMEHLLKVFGF